MLKLAAYLHDVGRPYQDVSKGTICHAEKGAEITRLLMDNCPLSKEQKTNILHCIRSHRFRGDCQPETLEAKVLFDADKLDAIGAIGIGRAYQFTGEVGAKFHDPYVRPEETEPYMEEGTGYREFTLKLFKIKDGMLTAEGRRMAKERHVFMEKYFERFFQEYRSLK